MPTPTPPTSPSNRSLRSSRKTSLTVERFTITTASGETFTGAVQGAGGILTDLATLERQVRLATRGRPLHVYEPETGHVALYADYNVWSNGRETLVDLRGARVEVAS